MPTTDQTSTPRLTKVVLLIALIQSVVLFALSGRYGYHGDEMYFIASGGHPSFGYPDQPPLVPLIGWFLNDIAPRSLFVLRLPADLAAAGITVITALMVRELGGARRPQVLAAIGTAISGFPLAAAHLFHTTSLDMFTTALTCWLIMRSLVRSSPRTLLWAGLTVGIGSEVKTQVVFVAGALFLAVLCVGPRWPFRSRWLLSAAVLALAGIFPYAFWQASHAWPQSKVAAAVAGTAEGGRAGFLPFQLVMASPVLVPVWIAGLVAPFRRNQLRNLRCFPVAYALLALAYLIGNGKAYYLASFYPALLAIGSIPAVEWAERALNRRILLVAGLTVGAIINGFVSLPLLPATQLQGSLVMALNPDQGGTVGWPQFVDTVSGVWHDLPASERTQTAIFTGNYSEAGAIDLLGRPLGLPRAYSGHNGYSLWGYPNDNDTHVLVTGFHNSHEVDRYFDACQTMATVDNHVGLDTDEQGLPVMLCRPTAGWPQLWPLLRHYD
jgi:4-amino-4-deoxy-L-arabinose transferase-like glycosyltransferase